MSLLRTLNILKLNGFNLKNILDIGACYGG